MMLYYSLWNVVTQNGGAFYKNEIPMQALKPFFMLFFCVLLIIAEFTYSNQTNPLK
jgi:hypothetical protein